MAQAQNTRRQKDISRSLRQQHALRGEKIKSQVSSQTWPKTKKSYYGTKNNKESILKENGDIR